MDQRQGPSAYTVQDNNTNTEHHNEAPKHHQAAPCDLEASKQTPSATLTITTLPGFRISPAPEHQQAVKLAALCATAHHRLVAFTSPITSMGFLYCLGSAANKKRGTWFRSTVGLFGFLSFVFHITMDFLESIWFRHISVAIIFACIIPMIFLLLPWVHLKSIPWALELLEQGSDAGYVATLSPGRRCALAAVARIPQTTTYYIVQAVVGTTGWMTMLYFEGVLGKEVEHFGLSFIFIHAFCTFCTFCTLCAVQSVQTDSPLPMSIAVAPILYTTELAKAFSMDMHIVSVRSQTDIHVATEKLETAVLRELAKIKTELRDGNKVSDFFCLVCVVSSINMAIFGSVSLVLDANARTSYLALLVFTFVMSLNFFMIGIGFGLRMSNEFAKIPVSCEEIVAQANWERLERYFMKSKSAFAFKVGGVPVNRGLLVRLFVVGLSLGATALQVQLYRS
jgi:hypothetical protein